MSLYQRMDNIALLDSFESHNIRVLDLDNNITVIHHY